MENSVDQGGNRIGENLNEIRQGIQEKTQEIRASLNSYVEEHPLGAVGIAFGIGYILSGALVSRLTARVVGIGGRIVLGNVLRQAVAGIGPGMILDALRSNGGGQQQASGGTRPQTEKH
jgi:hypothetical protein